MSESEEEEIIAAYQKGVPIRQILKDYSIRDFTLAYILGKHGVPLRAKAARGVRLTDVALVSPTDNSLRFPKLILTNLGLKKGQRVKFEVLDTKEMTVKLKVVS